MRILSRWTETFTITGAETNLVLSKPFDMLDSTWLGKFKNHNVFPDVIHSSFTPSGFVDITSWNLELRAGRITGGNNSQHTFFNPVGTSQSQASIQSNTNIADFWFGIQGAVSSTPIFIIGPQVYWVTDILVGAAPVGTITIVNTAYSFMPHVSKI